MPCLKRRLTFKRAATGGLQQRRLVTAQGRPQHARRALCTAPIKVQPPEGPRINRGAQGVEAVNAAVGVTHAVPAHEACGAAGQETRMNGSVLDLLLCSVLLQARAFTRDDELSQQLD